MFRLATSYTPTGDQPRAIDQISHGLIEDKRKNQVLLGVTGSGKTFTMAHVIAKTAKPTLIISHNKTLAGQLYQEFREFFPENAVSYFVSYYDYYQPEAYIPSSDTYIEKESQINETIDKLRLQSTANLMTRKDVIVVASVSCIYNIGDPNAWNNFALPITIGDYADWHTLSRKLVQMQYSRAEFDFTRGSFRLRGTYLDIYPAHEDFGYRFSSNAGKIDRISTIEPVSGKTISDHTKSPDLHAVVLYPAKHNLTGKDAFLRAEGEIRTDLARETHALRAQGKEFEARRLAQKVNYDLEIMKEVGYVNGIENYSRYLDNRPPGSTPYTLIDYFEKAYGNDYLVCIDESHISIPQIRGMYNGDQSRKKTLIEYGFRLQSALDNRPMKFDEFYPKIPHLLYVSATPDEWELEMTNQEDTQYTLPHCAYHGIAEQLVRPTGIIDPAVTVRPATGEIVDVIKEIQKRVALSERVLVTTLTKKMAEDLTEYLTKKNIKAAYLHSDVKTLERSDILEQLRKKLYDVLIGVNLLREGLDLPEVTLVAILDADKEGFLRSRTALIQTMGRAARNVRGEVILYADKTTESMRYAIDEITRRRAYQEAYNTKHRITPRTVEKTIREKIIEHETPSDTQAKIDAQKKSFDYDILRQIDNESLTPYDREKLIKKLERQMKERAQAMDFEAAIALRDTIKKMRE